LLQIVKGSLAAKFHLIFTVIEEDEFGIFLNHVTCRRVDKISLLIELVLGGLSLVYLLRVSACFLAGPDGRVKIG
jgi:hypothetical protein